VSQSVGGQRQFRRILEDAGVHIARTPRQGPNCNAYAERFVLSIKSECLDRVTLFGESSLRRAVAEYVEQHHSERAHRGSATNGSTATLSLLSARFGAGNDSVGS
jgi:transposase InsO family protein